MIAFNRLICIRSHGFINIKEKKEERRKRKYS